MGRGAQVYAQALRRELGQGPDEQLLVTIFAARATVLRPDVALNVPGGRMRRLGLEPRALSALARYLRSVSPHVVIAHGGEALKYAALVTPKRFPLVYYKIGTTAVAAHHGWRLALYRRLALRSVVVAAVSEEAADDARARGLSRAEVLVVPNGRAVNLAGAPRSGRAGPVHIVFAGHLTEGKRPGWFVDLCRQLRAEGADVRATLAGDGPLAGSLRRRADGSGIELIGHCDDIAGLLASADVLVFPSRPEGEGMPGVLIEAGLAGVPVVATDGPGVSTVLRHGQTGWVVPGNDQSALLDAVRSLVSDPVRRAAMGEAARRRCEEHYSIAASARLWQCLIDERAAPAV